MQYRLRTLMIVLTVLGIAAGLAVRFPPQAIRWTLVALPFLPAAMLLLIMSNNSRRPIVVSLISIAGCVVGLLLFRLISLQIAKPAVIRIPGESQLYVDVLELGLLTLGAAMGTLIFGGALLIEEFRRRGRAVDLAAPVRR
jgi:hypothetical protein